MRRYSLRVVSGQGDVWRKTKPARKGLCSLSKLPCAFHRVFSPTEPKRFRYPVPFTLFASAIRAIRVTLRPNFYDF